MKIEKKKTQLREYVESLLFINMNLKIKADIYFQLMVMQFSINSTGDNLLIEYGAH